MYLTLSLKDKERCTQLIDEWPENIQLTLDKIDPKNKEDNEEHISYKKFDDGTFEMISEFPDQPKRDMVQDLHKKVRLLNGGNNLIEFIKTLPVNKSNKMAMFQYIEKRHPERIPQFCEYLGLSESQVSSMTTYVELFQENGGPEMFLRAKDYEQELETIELDNKVNPDSTLLEERAIIEERKKLYDTKF